MRKNKRGYREGNELRRAPWNQANTEFKSKHSDSREKAGTWERCPPNPNNQTTRASFGQSHEHEQSIPLTAPPCFTTTAIRRDDEEKCSKNVIENA
jgi:hypothetical protein